MRQPHYWQCITEIEVSVGSVKIKMLCGFLVYAFNSIEASALDVDNLYFHGTLVAEACTINPGDKDIKVEFDPVTAKSFYSNSRTESKTFFIKLSGCDSKISSGVKISFSGSESGKLPGLLAIDPSSQASGIAIGFETKDGQPLKLNVASPTLPLEGASTVLPFSAYVQGEPEAIANKTVKVGYFSAVALFTISYN